MVILDLNMTPPLEEDAIEEPVEDANVEEPVEDANVEQHVQDAGILTNASKVTITEPISCIMHVLHHNAMQTT